MKTLVILRHGKAERHSDVGDIGRVLAERGRHDAESAGRAIADCIGAPDVAVSSPAARAHQTAVLAGVGGAWSANVLLDQRIYDDGPSDLLDVIRSLDDHINSALLVGHNPGFSYLAARLAKQPALDGGLPTAGLVILLVADRELAGCKRRRR